MKKFICPIKHYPNCRVCDSGFYLTTKFFNNKKQLMNYALEFIEEHAIADIFDSEGNNVGEIEYDLGYHSCNGIKVKIEGNTYMTKDNGKGKVIWSEL